MTAFEGWYATAKVYIICIYIASIYEQYVVKMNI